MLEEGVGLGKIKEVVWIPLFFSPLLFVSREVRVEKDMRNRR